MKIPDEIPDIPPLPGETDDDIARAEAEGIEDTSKDRKLYFRAWLWLQLSQKSKFAPIAKLILSGGPEGVWVGKPLIPEYVLNDVESFFASDRRGFDADMVKLMRDARNHYRKHPLSVSDLVEARLKGTDKTQSNRIGEGMKTLVSRVIADGDPESADDSFAGEKHPVDEEHPLLQLSKQTFVPGTMVPSVRCTYTETRRHGVHQCARVALPGADVCDMHGGEWISLEETKSILKSGQDRLVLASEIAITTVVDLMQNGVNEAVRLKAAEMVLDRTGFVAGVEVAVSGSGGTGKSPAEALRERLEMLAVPTPQPVNEEDVTDAEIVEDDETDEK